MAARLRKRQRLRTAREFRAAFRGVRARAGQREFLLLAADGGAPWHRLGLAVAKKHAAKAVVRNRIKRVARECFRHLPVAREPLDIVFLTRPGAGEIDRRALAAAVSDQLERLLQRAGRP